jgi:polysaccharide biosynthesis transport protein
MSFTYPMDRRESDGDERSFDLKALLAVFKRRWKAVALPLAVLVGLALLYSVTATRIYSADAKLVIEQKAGTIINPNDPSLNRDPNRRLLTEVGVLQGRAVRELVETTSGKDTPKVTATADTGADIIVLTAESPDPKKAVEAVDTYFKAYTDYRKEQALTDLKTAKVQAQQVIDLLVAEDEQLKTTVVVASSGTSSSSTTATTLPNPRKSAIAAELLTQRARLLQLETDIALRGGGAQLVSKGVASDAPVSPKSGPILGAALILGLALGLAFALLRETLNDRLQGRGDVEQMSHSPVLAEVETFLTSPEDPIGMNDRQTTQAESFNGMRASMAFLAIEGEIRSMLVTSALPGEGKSTVAMSTAATYALSGSSVLLIDADLRRPDVHSRLGLENEKGLSIVLSTGQRYKKFVQAVPHYTGLFALTSGPIPPNPFELLASEAMGDLIKAALVDYDIVIVDCPPVRPVSDVLALSGKVDGVLLVTNAKLSIRSEVVQAVRNLRQVDAKIIGAVLNQTRISRAKYTRYD